MVFVTHNVPDPGFHSAPCFRVLGFLYPIRVDRFTIRTQCDQSVFTGRLWAGGFRGLRGLKPIVKCLTTAEQVTPPLTLCLGAEILSLWVCFKIPNFGGKSSSCPRKLKSAIATRFEPATVLIRRFFTFSSFIGADRGLNPCCQIQRLSLYRSAMRWVYHWISINQCSCHTPHSVPQPLLVN